MAFPFLVVIFHLVCLLLKNLSDLGLLIGKKLFEEKMICNFV